ncbi:caspase family protein [Streptomyces sp. S.PNR 29]|uniref:wHTH domain-containing protein n=1 Tax=Streptomyces sp. S.PNR 29 TaxID=2973805 RepID=UPI0025B00D01|nr:caspase family protein [Streptomyces sp. S.PNR 29]MDN0199539.1 caspase family protein [Streptomyces sp. S.PNR 29]
MSGSGGGPGGKEGRFRALLVGVDHYSDPGFGPMPFITSELRGLADALKAAGYQDAQVLDADELHGTAIKTEVESFVCHAAPGDHLLLVLSGHGLHKDGADFLVTGPARSSSRHFLDTCLRIEFGDYLMDSKAEQLVVAVDACRVDFEDMFTKSGPDQHGWGKGGTGYGGRPRYAHVYACTRYGVAGFGPAAGPLEGTPSGTESKGFSYFTKALTEIAQDPAAPGSLDAMETLLDDRVRTIAQEDRGRSDQGVQINFATGREGLLLFPGRGPGGLDQAPEHRWQTAAVEHEAWRRVVCERLGDEEAADAVRQVRDAVARLVGLWGRETDIADAWLAEHGDIWRPAGSESRMSLAITNMLYESAPASGLTLTEAAMLVAAPFLYTAFGTRFPYLARDIWPWALVDGTSAAEECGFADRAAFDRYCAGHLALMDRERRARQRGRAPEARAIAWWLARQWLLRLPATREAVRRSGLAGLETLPDLPEFESPLVREVLSPARLWRLAELIGLDLEQWQPPEQDTVAAQRGEEHTLDWEKTGILLTVAHHMAVDPMLLSSLVAEHLGISAPVDGEAFRAALRDVTWQQDGPRRRALSTACPHLAVELALRDHTDALDRAVRTVQRGPAGERAAAWGVPAAFGAGKVTPALDENRRPRYDRADVRFRLDGDRVRDLLMGEQLYQDRTLALRELYQNALDACRYRKARTDLWNARHPDEPEDPWQGEIVFTQGEEDGRPFIECRDNGIGMGRHELRHLFAFAGSRFVEERQFLEEQAEWARAGIPFHANSRFGIGVLSYFMLADEIRVTTSRLPSDFGPGEKLVVDIDGPGALFRITPKGTSRWSGTAVRLYLRNPDKTVSCGEAMRKHLWVSDFSVKVKEGENEPLEWRPGVLSGYVGRDSSDPSAVWRYEGDTAPVQDAGDGVWWCGGRGAVLADGLWAGEARFGCVVNLTGKHAPKLRLDRGAMLDDHEEYVAGLLAEKIPVLFEEGGRVLSLEWLHALAIGGWPGPGGRTPPPGARDARRQTQLADLIAAQAVARGHEFPFDTRHEAGVVADAATVGCCPGDLQLVRRTRTVGAVPLIEEEPNIFVEWRARVWAASAPGSGVLPRRPLPVARPSDELLLSEISEDDGSPLPPGVVRAAARASGLPFVDAVDRLREFRLDLPDEEILRRVADVRNSRFLSRDGNGMRPWLPVGGEVSVAAVHSMARFGEDDPRSIVRLLAELGFRVPRDEELDAPPSPSVGWPPDPEHLARLVLRRHLEPTGPELPRDRPVTLPHLVRAVAAFPGQRARIEEVLVTAGYELPQDPVPDQVDQSDLEIISRDGDGAPPWISEEEPFPLHHLLKLSRNREEGVELLVQRLVALGFSPPELPPAAERNLYLRLVDDLSRYYHIDEYGAVTYPRPVEANAVLTLARNQDMTDRDVARLLTELGFVVPGLDEHPLQPRDYLDMVLMSRDHDGGPPWLDAESQVPRHHVLRAAHTLGLSPDEVVHRLTRYGYDVAREPSDGDWSARDDWAVLRRGSRYSVWLDAGTPVPLTHILRTAHHLGRTPTAVARRLEQLGHALPDDIEFTEPHDS